MVSVDDHETECADAVATARAALRDDLLYILDNDEDVSWRRFASIWRIWRP